MKKDIVQVKNSETGLFLKIDRNKSKILSYKKTRGRYKNIKIARNKNELLFFCNLKSYSNADLKYLQNNNCFISTANTKYNEFCKANGKN